MRVLLSGLGTVECAYDLRAGESCQIDFAALRLQREAIRRSRNLDSGNLNLGGRNFSLSPNSTRAGFPFLVWNKDCAIQFGEFNDPAFFVTYRSFGLWTRGARQLHEQFLRWAADLGFAPHRPEALSRVDFAFDVRIEAIDFDEECFVSVAQQGERESHRGVVPDFTLGHDDVVLRIYDISAEVEQSGSKYWLHTLWQGETDHVWRVEWQVRKEALKRFGLRRFTELFAGYGDLLRYLFNEHTSLRSRSDADRARWPLHPLWRLLIDEIEQMPVPGVSREVRPGAMLDEMQMRLAIGTEGNLKRLAALACLAEGRATLSHRQAVERLIALLEQVHNSATWSGDVQRRIDALTRTP